jgi:hypothetical protein
MSKSPEATIEAWDTVLLCVTLAATLVAKSPGSRTPTPTISTSPRNALGQTRS